MPSNSAARLPSVIDAISDLIKLPSVSCTQPSLDQSNRTIIELLANWFSELGFKIEIMETSQKDKLNLIATLGQGDGGLVLAGHTDTVPYDLHHWQSDPFTLKEKDGRLYGLGTSDMKSFFALVLEAAKLFSDKNPTHPLIIVATADEESSMNGAQALVSANKLKGRYAVIGEPTNLKPVNMHKGIMQERILVQGQAGHASNPALGNNAIDAMHQITTELMAYRDELALRFQNKAFSVAHPTLNLGCIHGGDSPNRICGECELLIDIRTLPGMNHNQVREDMRSRLDKISHRLGVSCTVESLFPGLAPFATPETSELIKAAEKLTAHNVISVGFGTEAPFLQALGFETIILGPGDIAQAHQPNEYVALDRLNPMITILKNLIQQFCY